MAGPDAGSDISPHSGWQTLVVDTATLCQPRHDRNRSAPPICGETVYPTQACLDHRPLVVANQEAAQAGRRPRRIDAGPEDVGRDPGQAHIHGPDPLPSVGIEPMVIEKVTPISDTWPSRPCSTRYSLTANTRS
jgi:hypothetical protein